jgi:glyoxylase-like metal-dependent hydrolase (beta-lactamase superfamily II)
VQAIWLTHHHADHIGGVAALKEALNVPVCAHRATAERLEGQLRIDEELYSGDIGELGGVPVEVIHTPGHARGHLAFGVGPKACLVAGDLVAGQGTIVIDPPEGDMGDYLATLGALVQRGVGVVVPAHGPAAEDGESLLLGTIAHRLMREDQLVEVLGQRGQQGVYPIDLVPTIYPEVPVMFHPLAARQVLAHLLKLEAEGRAFRPGGGRGVPGQPVYLPSAPGTAVPDAAFALVP